MYFKTSIVILLTGFSCTNDASGSKERFPSAIAPENFETPGKISQIELPRGYTRSSSTSFGTWLHNVKLKKDKTVYLYDGRPKPNQQAQYAVLDISVGNQNLQQCADAVMRMRAEYLFDHNRFEEISFSDNLGKKYRFSPPYTRSNLDSYLKKVFAYCGTASLAKQMKRTSWQLLQAGDVLIRGGFPGHAAMVMDVAENSSGERIYLLCQSYMPAQDIHILNNPSAPGSPWYHITNDQIISTPEYDFNRKELMTW